MGVGGRILTPLWAGPSYRAVEGMVVSEGSWVSAEEEPLQLPIGGGVLVNTSQSDICKYRRKRVLNLIGGAGSEV